MLVTSINDEIHVRIEELLNDPITKLLLSRSHLTKVQAETLFVELLTSDFEEKNINSDSKAEIRSNKGHLTRGAFNRSLNQSKINIQKSICTLLLLSYVGILPDSYVNSFEEAAERLKNYLKFYKDIGEEKSKSEDALKTLHIMRIELMIFLNEFMKV
jgi:hypothetical protein